ncbi:DUF3293 domain-containing protein [Deinococcus detaillensis]|uniref:DUF3293 domain-containing protein n=1 Tax=Deinococcus detaillensis TaxID=2592048 RepID=A0A553V6S1_9DEIO|nr:DUF3293 domain-containing protein [Deinococcus detaillensis]
MNFQSPPSQLRSAFLSTSYGTAQRRYQLSHAGGVLPFWSLPQQRWAILTAWNPHGQASDPASNAEAQSRLRAALAAWPALEGVNGEGNWAEPSLIVPALNLRRALEIGQDFGQAALIWGVGRRAALVWCAPDVRVERFWMAAAGAYGTGQKGLLC